MTAAPVSLNTGLNLHRRGQLGQAAAVYRQVLQQNPRNPDALHLLGVALHQSKRHEEAAKLIERAIGLKPEVADYHNNLGEAYREQHQLDKALSYYRNALEYRAQYPDAIHNIGVVYYAQEKHAEAAEQFRKAIELQPDYNSAYLHLAQAIQQMGEGHEAQAIEAYQTALERNPTHAGSHSNLSMLLLNAANEAKRAEVRDQTGKPATDPTPTVLGTSEELEDQALQQGRRAVELDPKMPEAWNNLGNALRRKGELKEAREAYVRALNMNPNLAQTFSNLAHTYIDETDLPRAIAHFKEAVKRDPTNPRFLMALGLALDDAEQHDQAETAFTKVVELHPEAADGYIGLASVQQQRGMVDLAMNNVLKSIELKGDIGQAHYMHGHLLEQLGRMDEAEAAFRRAQQHEPDMAVAYSQLASMLRSKLPESDVATMHALLEKSDEIPARKLILHYGLAQYHDATQQYDKAAQNLAVANALRKEDFAKRGRSYNPDEHRLLIDRLIENFTPELFEKLKRGGSDSARPIFIFGMPRSATTLTEQILASHDRVFGAGELRIVGEQFRLLPQYMDRPGEAPGLLIRDLTPEAIARCAASHSEELDKINPTLECVADKMPDNYMLVGLMAAMYPKARFIHTRRDLRDIAVSCWMTNFKNIHWATDMEHIAHRLNQYVRVMDHWRKVLPVPMLEVDYQDTVHDFEGTARKLLDFCGLDWTDKVMQYHKAERAVRTASLSQVRRQIYTTSLDRWRNYEKPLSPLFEKLPATP